MTSLVRSLPRKEMAAIWEPENRFRIWLEVELLACEAQAELGVIPKDAPAKIRKKADFDVESRGLQDRPQPDLVSQNEVALGRFDRDVLPELPQRVDP